MYSSEVFRGFISEVIIPLKYPYLIFCELDLIKKLSGHFDCNGVANVFQKSK